MGLTDRMKPDKEPGRMFIIEGETDACAELNVLATKIGEHYTLGPTGENPDILLIAAISPGVFEIGSALKTNVPPKFVEEFAHKLKTLCYEYWKKEHPNQNT